MEGVVRQLLEQAAETRNLDYKGPMAWQGPKATRAELVRDLMCFANTPDGGYILVGVQETSTGPKAVGVTEKQAKTFDPTPIGDLAQGYCSVLPVFRVHRVSIDGRIFVLLTVDEFGDQPIVCTKDLHGPNNELVLRAGAVYTRTVDAKSTEIRTGEDMQRLLDLAVRKRGDALLAQIAGLLGTGGRIELPLSDEERFARQRAAGEQFFTKHELTGFYWQVEIRPEGFAERLAKTRADLTKVRDDADVALRGWNFPHVDREHSGNFADGVQSWTKFRYHHEAHRVFRSGLFLWRGLIREDFEATKFRNTLIYESTIWSFTEIWLFANRFLSSLLQGGNAVVDIAILGLEGRRLVQSGPPMAPWEEHTCEENDFRQRVALPLGELRASYLERAASGVIDLFELFGVSIPVRVIGSWQEKLLKREF